MFIILDFFIFNCKEKRENMEKVYIFIRNGEDVFFLYFIGKSELQDLFRMDIQGQGNVRER